ESGTVRYGEGQFIGYRGLDAMQAEVSYPFGHGLTYTSFDYTDLSASATEVTDQTEPGDAVVHLSARVHNTGERRGVAVPQLYVSRPGSQVVRRSEEHTTELQSSLE